MKKSYYLLSALLFVLPFATHAASFTLTPDVGSFEEGSVFTSTVYVKPDSGETVTAAELSLQFPTDTLEIVSFTPTSGLLAPVAPKIDNTSGTLKYTAAFMPGITTKSMFGTLVFKGKVDGTANVTFASDAKLLDPTNANKYVRTSGGQFVISAPVVPESEPIVVPPVVSTPPPVLAPKEENTESAVVASTSDIVDTEAQATKTQKEGIAVEDVPTVTSNQTAAAGNTQVDAGTFHWYYYLIPLLVIFLFVGYFRWRKKD